MSSLQFRKALVRPALVAGSAGLALLWLTAVSGGSSLRPLSKFEMTTVAVGAVDCTSQHLDRTCTTSSNCYGKQTQLECTAEGGCSSCTETGEVDWDYCLVTAPNSINCTTKTTLNGCGKYLDVPTCQWANGACACVGKSLNVPCDSIKATSDPACDPPAP